MLNSQTDSDLTQAVQQTFTDGAGAGQPGRAIIHRCGGTRGARRNRNP